MREMSQDSTYGRCTLGLLTLTLPSAAAPQLDSGLRVTPSHFALALDKTPLRPTTHNDC